MDNNDIVWNIFHSLWILISFFLFFNGIGFILIGLRVNEKKWIYEGILYEVPFIVGLLVTSNETLLTIITYILLITWLISIIRSFMLRKEYLNRLRQKSFNNYNNVNYNQNNNLNQTNYQTNFSTDYNNNNQNVNKTDFNPDINSSSIDNNVNTAFDTNSNISSNENINNFSLIDINRASIEEISRIPGISGNNINKIIELRNNGIYFKSLDDMAVKLNLSNHEINQISQFIEISPINTSTTNRRLDL